jgi:hypothetical protein
MQKKAVTSIPELLDTHRKICGPTEEAMLHAKERSGPERLRAEGLISLEHYKILLLCRAIMVVIDQSVPRHEIDRITSATGEHITHPSSVPAFTPLQNVLLVRTGDEADLSASIDFSELAKYALPRERPDISFMSEPAVIRVSLPVAVEYMCGLQRREEDARPEFYTHLNSNTDRSQNPYLTPIDVKLPLFYSSDVLLYPADEDEFVREVYREGVYREGVIEGYWIEDAMARVKRREAGNPNWDDLVDFVNWGRRCS